MRRALRSIPLAVALLVPVGAAPPVDAQISIQFRWGTRDRPLAGHRYQVMRALAHELDGRARHALEQVAETTPRTRSARRLLRSLEDFASRAADFHQRMDDYVEHPWNLPPTVQELAERANGVSLRFRRVPTFRHTAEDWNETVDVVNRMQRVLGGHDVPMPRPHRWNRDRDYDDHHRDYEQWEGGSRRDPPRHDFGYGERSLYMDPQTLEEMRRLAEALVDRSERADRDAGHWRDPFGDGHAESLDHFVEEARHVREIVAAGRVDVQQLRPRIDHLRSDVQRASRHIHQTQGLARARDDWNEVGRILERMAQLAR